ncbi:hypothetical protein NKL05_01010 [Mesorhizobium sp. C420B]
MFAAYTSGRPPREIAQDLNREGVLSASRHSLERLYHQRKRTTRRGADFERALFWAHRLEQGSDG